METLVSKNPATGEKIGEVPLANEQEVIASLKKAHGAFFAWRQTKFAERLKYVKNLRQILVERADEIAKLISKEQGKRPCEALAAEIFPVLDTLEYLQQKAKKLLAPSMVNYRQLLFSHKKAKIHYVPYGLISVIAPWNFPFSLPLIPALEAIFAGNTVVLKPSPFTPVIAWEIKRLMDLAGFPQGVFEVVACQDELAALMVDNDFTRKVIFTGSVATGRKVMQTAAKRLIPVVLELGGKDPAIVTANAKLDRAAAGIAWGAFMNAGQICASVERVYVERSVYPQFLQKLRKEWEMVTKIPMIHHCQKQLVIEHLVDAKNQGAKVLCGGEYGKDDQFVEPTVLSDCTPQMKVMQDETFGPLCAIMPVDSFSQALELANNSIYGLASSLWSDNLAEQRLFLSGIESATATVNDCIYSFGEPSAPWGGMKMSGIGRTHSIFGLMEMVQPKYTSVDNSKKRNMWWYPYTPEYDLFLRDAIIALHHANLWVKFKHTLKLPFYKRFWKCLSPLGLVKGFIRRNLFP